MSVLTLLLVAGAETATFLPAKAGALQAPVSVVGLQVLAPVKGSKQALSDATPGKKYERLALKASAAGHFDLDFGGVVVKVDVVEVQALDHEGKRIDPQRSHASFSRTLPPELGSLPSEDVDALSFSLIAPAGVELDAVEVLTRRAKGEPLDVLPRLRTLPMACPAATAPELVCRRTPPIRAVADPLDRSHPSALERSVRAELGGTVRLSSAGRQLIELPVGGPRQSRVGPIERLRAKLRVLILRSRPGGPAAIGSDDRSAKQLAARELASASSLWGQCGIELVSPENMPIQVVDPPPAELVSVGCGLALPASGGVLSLVEGRRKVQLETRAGQTPAQVAGRLAEVLQGAQRRSLVFENQRTANATLPTADVLLTATPASRDALQLSSTDPTLPLCLGQLDLSEGLAHFSDGDAFSGTLEERALLRALDDGDPTTIELLIVPSFEREERIGESFISSAGSSLSNAVIIDRSAIRAGARSFALAHELGHVLLAMPGHPDDFGIDQSWSLLDADVSDPTIFGPRRLSVADCERAIIETGPDSPTPLLERVPLR